MNLHTTFVYNKSNPFGISQDVVLFEEALRAATKQAGFTGPGMQKPRHADPMEPAVLTDICFHFEVPIYTYFPWSRKTVVIVNPEWWEIAWDSYLPRIDALLFKCESDRQWFLTHHPQASSCFSMTIPWSTSARPETFAKLPQSHDSATGFLWLLGASVHKRAAADHILPLWKESWPTLNVYTTTPLQTQAIASNVKIHVGDLDERRRHGLQAYTPGHLIFSRAEAAGLAALEGEAAGAFLLGNDLPCFDEMFSDSNASALLPASLAPIQGKAGRQDTFSDFSLQQLEDSIQHFMTTTNFAGMRAEQKKVSEERRKRFFTFVATAWKDITGLPNRFAIRALPPVLTDAECPKISVITLLHNRRKFVDLALHNLLITDYPKDKIEWVVVEDSDKTEEQASDKVMKFARDGLGPDGHTISVSYIPLQKIESIGEKRNLACKRAQHDICLMMDDDDHYPPSSFRRRVAWLIKHPWLPKAACATTIACYDLLKGTSAVNTPPFTLGLAGRVSEATLTFRKSFWEERPFPTANMCEGEGFLLGREQEVMDIQPQQIIVAMSHGSNASSRRIPPGPSGKPSCFWGFPKEFLVFLHRLAGVEIE